MPLDPGAPGGLPAEKKPIQAGDILSIRGLVSRSELNGRRLYLQSIGDDCRLECAAKGIGVRLKLCNIAYPATSMNVTYLIEATFPSLLTTGTYERDVCDMALGKCAPPQDGVAPNDVRMDGTSDLVNTQCGVNARTYGDRILMTTYEFAPEGGRVIISRCMCLGVNGGDVCMLGVLKRGADGNVRFVSNRDAVMWFVSELKLNPHADDESESGSEGTSHETSDDGVETDSDVENDSDVETDSDVEIDSDG